MVLQIKFQSWGCQGAVAPTSVEASQSGSYPVLYSLWIQSHATSVMIQANKTHATDFASFLCDSLLNQSLAWAHQMGWHCLIWSLHCNGKVGKGRRVLNWTQMLQGNWSGYRDNPFSESTSVNSCDIYNLWCFCTNQLLGNSMCEWGLRNIGSPYKVIK